MRDDQKMGSSRADHKSICQPRHPCLFFKERLIESIDSKTPQQDRPDKEHTHKGLLLRGIAPCPQRHTWRFHVTLVPSPKTKISRRLDRTLLFRQSHPAFLLRRQAQFTGFIVWGDDGKSTADVTVTDAALDTFDRHFQCVFQFTV
jgi:hypothetical protein